MTKVYLAGPDVFLPDAADWFARKKAICAAYRLIGVSPLDDLPDQPAGWSALPEWRRIALRNEAHIRSCDAIIANLTPFRGPSADAGTVYEIGFARGIGLKVFGYATVTAPFLDRTLAAIGGGRQAAGRIVVGPGRPAGRAVRPVRQPDDRGRHHRLRRRLIAGDRDRWHDLSVFERCVQAAAARSPPHSRAT